MFVSLLKVRNCDSLFLNQVFVNIKSYAVTKSRITSSNSFLTPYFCLHELFQSPHYLFKPRQSIPYQYWPYRPVYTVLVCISVSKHQCFIRFKYRLYQPCIDHTSQFRTILASTGCTGPYRKKFYLFIYFILSFVIFEFLLGQNDNLFALTYQYYLFSQYATVTFKLSIFFSIFSFN